MKPKEFEIIYKLTVTPTVSFQSALNWDVEAIGELIRCKDCKHYRSYAETIYGYCNMAEWHNRYQYQDDFCSRAERKEE